MTSDVHTIEEGTIGLSESERHRLLAAERRRVVLDVLADCGLPIDLETLAEEVAVREGRVDAEAEGAVNEVDGVTITLHHHHLPVLVDADAVEYDRHDKLVGRGSNFDRLFD